MAITGGPIFRHAQIRWDASHCRSGFNHQLYTHFEHLAAHASIPHGQVFFHRVLRILSLYLDDRGRKKGHQSYQPYRMMVSARIGTPKKSQQNGFNIIIPDWKGPIPSFSGVFIGFQLIHVRILYMQYNVFIPSAPFGTSKNPLSRSALEEAKSAQISERIALLALADADHLQKSFSSAGAGIQGRQIGLHHVMSILVCFHTAPYYIPGILC